MTRPVGVQSYTYRNFTNEEIRDELAETDVEAIELCDVHVDPFDEEAGIRARDLYEDAAIDVCGFGVHNFEKIDDVEAVLSFAAEELGAGYVSLHVDPERRAVIGRLCEVAEAYGLLLGVHNHGPGHLHDTLDDVQRVLEGTPTRLGACVDTGHFLRSNVTPAQSIPALGERVHAVHLKDFIDEEIEVIPGDGRIDVEEVLALLDEHAHFDQPLIIEYEEDPDDPTPAVETIVERVRTAEESRTR